MEIRRPLAAEAEDICRMYDGIIDDTAGKTESPRWTKGVYPDLPYIIGAIERGEMIAAFDAGVPVGAVVRNHVMAPGYERAGWKAEVSSSEVYVVHTLGIDPDHQHLGIASMLMEAVIDEARQDGMKAVRCDIIDGNAPSIKLFEKLGFINHGESILDYDGMDGVPFTLMEYILP